MFFSLMSGRGMRIEWKIEITDELQGCFVFAQAEQAGGEVDHVAVCLAAETMETPIDLHARMMVVVKRAERHPGRGDL